MSKNVFFNVVIITIIAHLTSCASMKGHWSSLTEGAKITNSTLGCIAEKLIDTNKDYEGEFFFEFGKEGPNFLRSFSGPSSSEIRRLLMLRNFDSGIIIEAKPVMSCKVQGIGSKIFSCAPPSFIFQSSAEEEMEMVKSDAEKFYTYLSSQCESLPKSIDFKYVGGDKK